MKYSEEVKDLFTASDSYYLAHCISADLAMGAGIAVEFNKRYGMKKKLSGMGSNIMAHWSNGFYGFCLLKDNVFNLITKKYYWEKPTYETLTKALEDMRRIALEREVKKIAMPLIGCGLDKLSWGRVSEIIKKVFGKTDIEILVCSK